MPNKIRKVSSLNHKYSALDVFFNKLAVLDEQTTEKLLNNSIFIQKKDYILKIRQSLEQLKKAISYFLNILNSKTTSNVSMKDILIHLMNEGYNYDNSDIRNVDDSQTFPVILFSRHELDRASGLLTGLGMVETEVEELFQEMKEEGLVDRNWSEDLGNVLGVDKGTLNTTLEILHKLIYSFGYLILDVSGSFDSANLGEDIPPDYNSLKMGLEIILEADDAQITELQKKEIEDQKGPSSEGIGNWTELIDGDNQQRELILSKYNITLEEFIPTISKGKVGISSSPELIKNSIKDFIKNVRKNADIQRFEEIGMQSKGLVDRIRKNLLEKKDNLFDNDKLFVSYYGTTDSNQVPSFKELDNRYQSLMKEIAEGISQTNLIGISDVSNNNYRNFPELKDALEFFVEIRSDESGQLKPIYKNFNSVFGAGKPPYEFYEAQTLADEIVENNFEDLGIIKRFLRTFKKLIDNTGKHIDTRNAQNSLYKVQKIVSNDQWFLFIASLDNFLERSEDAITVLEKSLYNKKGGNLAVSYVSEEDIKESDKMLNDLAGKKEEITQNRDIQNNKALLGDFYYTATQLIEKFLHITTATKMFDILDHSIVFDQRRSEGAESRNVGSLDMGAYGKNDSFERLKKMAQGMLQDIEDANPVEFTGEEELDEHGRIRGEMTKIMVYLIKDYKILGIYLNDYSYLAMRN